MTLSFVEVLLSPAVLTRLGLPPLRYEVPADLARVVEQDPEHPPLDALLFALQHRAAQPEADWLRLNHAIDVLTQHLSLRPSPHERELEEAWRGQGEVNLWGRVVTLQRQGTLIAAIDWSGGVQPCTAVYAPLCGRGIRLLTGLGLLPGSQRSAAPGAEIWASAVEAAAAGCNLQAALEGRAYLAWWSRGVGVGEDGFDVGPWPRAGKQAVPRSARLMATEIGVFSHMSQLLGQLPAGDVEWHTPLPEAFRRQSKEDKSDKAKAEVMAEAGVKRASGRAPGAGPKWKELGRSPSAERATTVATSEVTASAQPDDDEDWLLEPLEGPPPLDRFDLSTEQGRFDFFLALFDHPGETGLLPAVNHIWTYLLAPRSPRCALMAKRVGRSGSGKRALIAFIRRFLEEAHGEWDVPALPAAADYLTTEAWNAAVRAHFIFMDQELTRLLRRYEAILDGRLPEEDPLQQEEATGLLIKGP